MAPEGKITDLKSLRAFLAEPGVRQRLAYGSFVSERHKLFFLDAPKNASTTIKWVLADLEGAEITPEPWIDETDLSACIHDRSLHPLPTLLDFPEERQLSILTSAEYRRACVVRNPYARLVSAWADKIRQVEPGFSEVCDEIMQHSGDDTASDVPTFREFANWVTQTNDPAACDAHWRAQTALLEPDRIQYTHFLRAEKLAEDLNALFSTGQVDVEELVRDRSSNVALPVEWEMTYDDELASAVANFYARDFTAFGFDTESWKPLVKRASASAAEVRELALELIRGRNAVIEAHARPKSRGRKSRLPLPLASLFRKRA